MFWGYAVLISVVGYLLGTLNGAILISKLLCRDDVRSHGSGNAGLTNFFRSYGGLRTLLVLFIDVGKTVAAALFGGWLIQKAGGDEMLGRMLGGAFSVIGHMFPVFFHFRGGKGILCCGTLGACMDWRIIVVLLSVFILTVVLTRYVSLGSILGAVSYLPTFLWRFWGNVPVLVIAGIISALAILMHHKNIARLIAGTESKLSFHSKENKA